MDKNLQEEFRLQTELVLETLPKLIEQHGAPHTITVTFAFDGLVVSHDIRVFESSGDEAKGE